MSTRSAEPLRPAADRPLPRLCAHRGLSLACPENTLPAFAAALAVGAHELELDLWLSRDGHLVVCHDPTVDRTTDGTGRIDELTWAEIRGVDAGVRLGEPWRGIRVPRFEQVLDLTAGRIGLNIHLKAAGPGGQAVRQVCDLLRAQALTDVAYVAGDEPVLEVARGYASEVERACLAQSHDPARQTEVARRYGCRRVQFGRHVTPAQIRHAHDVGLVCNLFWSDDPVDAAGYVRAGIDVVLTNCAHQLLAAGFPVA